MVCLSFYNLFLFNRTLKHAYHSIIKSNTALIQIWSFIQLAHQNAHTWPLSLCFDTETMPSRPLRCDVWIVERMRYRQTDQPTNRPTVRPSYTGALSYLKTIGINCHFIPHASLNPLIYSLNSYKFYFNKQKRS